MEKCLAVPNTVGGFQVNLSLADMLTKRSKDEPSHYCIFPTALKFTSKKCTIIGLSIFLKRISQTRYTNNR